MRKVSPSGIPFEDWGGAGPPMHFAHANGFPPGTYRGFAAYLTGHFRVLGMECRALWGGHDPCRFRHWRQMGEDLACFLREMQLYPILAAGHSLGAVTSLFCAISHPEMIQALILVDPVILPAWFAPLWAVAMSLGLNRRAPLAVQARRRRIEWPSRQVLLRAYRSAPVFKHWREPFLQDYVSSGTAGEDGDGCVRLRYDREWEARVFETPPPDIWCVMSRLRRLPVLVIRGEHSDTYRKQTMQIMRWLLPHAQFLEMPDADHFVPMCCPEETAGAIVDFCLGLMESRVCD